MRGPLPAPPKTTTTRVFSSVAPFTFAGWTERCSSQSFFSFFFFVSIVFRFTRAIIIVSTHFSCWTRQSFYESFLSYYIHPRTRRRIHCFVLGRFGLLQLRSLNEHRHRLGEGIVGPDGGPVFQTSARLCRNRRPNGRRNRSHPLLRFLQGSARVSLFFFFYFSFLKFISIFWFPFLDGGVSF